MMVSGYSKLRGPGVSRDWPWGVVLVLAVITTYLPLRHAGFIWDDDQHFTQNPCIIGPLGLKELWTTTQANYYPLTLTSFWFEHALWGLAPLPFHLVNVLLHAACAVLLWRVLLALEIPGAWLGAALWALHPVQVETAAWVTEMKNTQSGFFYLLAILFYIRGLRATQASRWNYPCILILAALSLLSKSSTLILPLVLGLCAWWIEGRWQWRHLARLVPIAVLSILAALLTMWTQHAQYAGFSSHQFDRSFPERLAASGDVIWFYLSKLAWPHPLVFIYPRWRIDPASPISWLPLLAVVAVVLVLWRRRELWARAAFFAFAYFIAALLPVLGLVDGFFWRYSLVGDHFQYLASMGPLALAGAGLHRLARFVPSQRKLLPVGLGAGLLLLLGALSWQRTAAYQNIDALWFDTIAQNPACWMAHNNLGLSYYDRGQLDLATQQFQMALAIDPSLAEPHNNLGNILNRQHALAPSIHEYQAALAIDPYYSRAHNNLGNALMQTGHVDDAITHYQRAAEIDPTYVDAYSDLSIALLQKGRTDDAIAQAQQAVTVDPKNADAHNNLGNALYQKGAMDAARREYQTALAIDPRHAKAHNGLGNALNQTGHVDDAIGEYQAALLIDPDYAEAHNDLGVTLLQKGRIDDAIAQFQQAVRETPTDANTHYSLGYALLQKGQVDDAVAQFQIVVQLDPGNASAQKNLAQAQALARKTAPPK
jgi:tetratricopeptide (TPR) repeat protein